MIGLKEMYHMERSQRAEEEKAGIERQFAEEESLKAESIQAGNPNRVVSADGTGVAYFRSPDDKRKIESLRFEIEDLLSPDNLQDITRVMRLQDLLNKYVLGSNVLSIDGNYSYQTAKIVELYRNVSKKWQGDPFGLDVNPLVIYGKYIAGQKAHAERVDITRPLESLRETRKSSNQLASIPSGSPEQY